MQAGSYISVRFAVVKRKPRGTEITKLVFHGLQEKKVKLVRKLQKMPTNGD